MKVLVTGANGFLGRHIVRGLSVDHSVLPVARRNLVGDAACATSDYTVDSLVSLMHGVETVVHLAASRFNRATTSECLSNTILDQRVFEAAERAGVPHVVFASSRGVYGLQPAPWTEQCAPAPVTLYALAKLQSELSADFYSRRGMPVTVLRLSQLFGDGEYEGSAVNTFIDSARYGRRATITMTGMRREYTYVDDIVEAVKLVLMKPTAGIFNLGGGEVLDMETLARHVFRAFGRSDTAVEVVSDAQVSNEYSLMDSSLFRRTFGWRPQWTLSMASAALAEQLGAIPRTSA